MTIGWFFKALTQYADFQQRARRREYWWFVVTAYMVEFILLGFTLVTLNNAWDGSTLDTDLIGVSTWIMVIGTLAVSLFLLIPHLAVTVRRMHDSDHSGWWALFLLALPLVVWIMACFDGTPGPNRYGPDPKELERGAEA
jgi:uncharacterized membrane protein YhaH (DUF805 family)